MYLLNLRQTELLLANEVRERLALF